MAQHYFKRYIWLISTIQMYGHITLKELSEKWEASSVNSDKSELSRRTFHNHKAAIEETFGITIKYSNLKGYYIGEDEELGGKELREWMLDCLQLNNILEESATLRNNILLENIPSGGRWLTTIIEAIKNKKALEMSYQSFNYSEPATFCIHPYCLKLFKQRWYMLGRSEHIEKPRIYSLDRIKELQLSKIKLQIPKKFNARDYFQNYFGAIINQDIKPCFIELWADSAQAKYFKSLPLHHSQQIKEENEEGTIFEYYLAPTFDFKQEILRHGAQVKILSPKDLQKDVRAEIAAMSKLYK